MREIMKDKKVILGIAGVAIFIIMISVALSILASERRDLLRLKEQRKEMIALRDTLLLLGGKVRTVEAKKGLSNVEGIAQAVEEVSSSVGLKDRVKTVKSTGKRETRDGFEEEADVYIEKVTMNEMVNMFYRIRNAPMVLTVKKITIKKSFENPELLNISMILSFLKSK
jgi:general secretion pathway protein M